MAMREHHNGDGFYFRLEVAPTASQLEITRAYRRLAHGAHPDAHPDDPDASRRFREITEAYEVLGDPARRARYDANQARRSVASPPPGAGNLAGARRAGAAGPHPAPTSGPLRASPWPGSPVYIGTWARPAPPALLWAGPARVEAPPQSVGPGFARGGFHVEVARLLSELFASWEWY